MSALALTRAVGPAGITVIQDEEGRHGSQQGHRVAHEELPWRVSGRPIGRGRPRRQHLRSCRRRLGHALHAYPIDDLVEGDRCGFAHERARERERVV
jgi:hypothetical protein